MHCWAKGEFSFKKETKARDAVSGVRFQQAAPWLGFDAAAGRVSGTRTAALPGFVEIPACGVGTGDPAKEEAASLVSLGTWEASTMTQLYQA